MGLKPLPGVASGVRRAGFVNGQWVVDARVARRIRGFNMLNNQQTKVTIISVKGLTRLWGAKSGEGFGAEWHVGSGKTKASKSKNSPS